MMKQGKTIVKQLAISQWLKRSLRMCCYLGLWLLAITPPGQLNAAPDSKGTEFWLAFSRNANFEGVSPTLTLFITGDNATTGTVTIPGLSFSSNFSVTPGAITAVSIPVTALVTTLDGIVDLGIHVTALDEVVVYGLNQRSATTDAFLGLPVDVLGTEYLIMSYNDLVSVAPSLLVVVGTQDNTLVTITPSANTAGRTAGVPYNVVLDSGEVYQLGTSANLQDLTGSRVISDKPVAVFGSHDCAYIPPAYAACDHLTEQLPPVSTWGQKFVTFPLSHTVNGDIFRYLASEDNTNVYINGSLVATLSAGGFYENIMTAAAVVTSDNPILVAQYSPGQTFNNGISSDPFMMLIPPTEQFLAGYTVATPGSGFSTNTINIVAPNSSVGSIILDGTAISPGAFTAIGGSGFSGTQQSVSVGTHNLSGPLPFGVFSYGTAQFDSYGYPGGQAFAAVATVNSVAATPENSTNLVGDPHCIDAKVYDNLGDTVVGVRVDFEVTGANPQSGFAFTGSNGVATFCYVGTVAGADTIEASVGVIVDTVYKTYQSAPLPPVIPVMGGDSLCQKILASDGAGSDRFGKAVAINGSGAIVGAHSQPDNGKGAGAAYVYTNVGGTWMEEDKLLPLDGDAGDQFGSSVDISGDYAIVGAPYDKPAGFASGSAYIFFRTGGIWAQQAKLVSSDLQAADFFGYSVAICDSYAVIGALGDDDKGPASGSVYIFHRTGSTWTQVAKVTASDGGPNDYFGFDVDIDITCYDMIVGAHRNSDDGTHSGSAYIFHRTGSSWSQVAHLKASDAAARDSFGYSVDMYLSHAIVGAPGDDDNGSNSGSAYVFENMGGTWMQTGKLTATDGEANDWFGWSVGITDGLASVGAWGEDDEGIEAGASYIFQNSGGIWVENRKIIPEELEAYDNFGFSVGISGDYVIIGAKGDDDKGFFAGAAYICLLTEPKDTLFASDPNPLDRLGFSTHIKGSYAIAGAPNDDEAAENAGAAYVYHKMGSDWPEQMKLTASDADVNDHLGWSVGISENYAISGAPNNMDAGFATGAAYVFARSGSTWTEQMKLMAPTPKTGDYFGYSVAVSENYAVVGALGNDDKATQGGAAFVFTRSGAVWTLTDTLYATDPGANDYFGFSVDIDCDGEDIIVGSPRNDDGGTNSGSAYIYHRTGSTWMSQGKLLATDDDALDSFGFSVAIEDEYAIIGAVGDDEASVNAGAAYIFMRSGSTWSQQAKLLASDGDAGDWFGNSVGTDGQWAAVGAPFEDDSAIDAGAAYTFMRSGSTWTETAKYKDPTPVANDQFGYSISVSDARAIIGIPRDDTKAPDAGAACIINLTSPTPTPMLVPDNTNPLFNHRVDLSTQAEGDLQSAVEVGEEEAVAECYVLHSLPYPNPTRDAFNFVILAKEAGDVRMEIISMSGRLVTKELLQVPTGYSTHYVNLGDQKGGIYMINLIFSNGERMMHRVVVQR